MDTCLDGIQLARRQVLEHQLEVHWADPLVGIQAAELQVGPSGGKKTGVPCLVETHLMVVEVDQDEVDPLPLGEILLEAF